MSIFSRHSTVSIRRVLSSLAQGTIPPYLGRTKAKCHTTCIIFEVRSSALAPDIELKRYYEPNLMCQ